MILIPILDLAGWEVLILFILLDQRLARQDLLADMDYAIERADRALRRIR